MEQLCFNICQNLRGLLRTFVTSYEHSRKLLYKVIEKFKVELGHSLRVISEIHISGQEIADNVIIIISELHIYGFCGRRKTRSGAYLQWLHPEQIASLWQDNKKSTGQDKHPCSSLIPKGNLEKPINLTNSSGSTVPTET